MTTTFQVFGERIFVGPNARQAAEAFAAKAGEQAGKTFTVISTVCDDLFGVDLTVWPEDTALGPWFLCLLAEFNVEIDAELDLD